MIASLRNDDYPALMTRKQFCLALGLGSVLPPHLAHAQTERFPDALKRLHEASGVPAVASLLLKNGKLEWVEAVGIRKKGEKTKVKKTDKFHLGSNTKAMTATLAAILVEKGVVSWDTTLSDHIKNRWLHEGFREVTLTQLLSHAGGCPGSPSRELWLETVMSAGRTKPVKQREALLKGVLSVKPAFTPGEGYEYSNCGYAAAGLILERASRTPWEKLITRELFKPLGMKSAGFRAPASDNRLDHPWGHSIQGQPVPPRPSGDNPDAIGPGATVHCTISDWARFANLHLEAEPGSLIKEKETFDFLHRVHNQQGNYGMGWLVQDHPEAGRILAHDGSNTMWFA
ncbi:MAG: serine hydrolase domain-containing protein, partial [Verrucomicrobiota bacterium]